MARSTRQKRWLVTSVLGLVLLATSLADATPTEVMVRATNAPEHAPAADDGYVAWVQWTGREWNAFAKPDGETQFQVDRPGWHAWMGGIDGTTLVYQEFRPAVSTWLDDGTGGSDLKLFELAGRTRRNPPAGVNTDAWEFWPSIDGDWLLFGRITRRVTKVILFNMADRTSRTLWKQTTDGLSFYPSPGEVNGNYASFDACDPRGTNCNVYRYDIAAGTRMKVPNPAAWQFAPSISSDGTMYFWRSETSCPYRTKLVRHPLFGDEEVLVTLPLQFSAYDTYVSEGADGGLEVFYDRYDACGGGRSGDVYKVNDSFTLTVALQGTGTGSVTSSPAGIDCGADCSQFYGGGTMVNLTPVAGEGSNFTGWGGACSGMGPCTVEMDQDRSVVAMFDTA